MWKMGSLSKQMMTTAMTFFVGSLALAGIWPLAGFYSKDMILASAYGTQHYILFGIGLLTAFMTSFYMTRVCALTFMGEPRERDRFAHAHESPWTMTVPLIVLALLSVVVGKLLMMHHAVNQIFFWPGVHPAEEPTIVMLLAISAALLGILVGWMIYLSPMGNPKAIATMFQPIYVLLSRKYFVDEIYMAALVRPTLKLGQAMAWFDDHVLDRIGVDGTGWVAEKLGVIQGWLDDRVVDKGVDGSGWLVQELGGLARRAQTGFVQNYLLMIALGFVVLVFWRIF
jgi:NADH-quinone oxidoreductase subunit L